MHPLRDIDPDLIAAAKRGDIASAEALVAQIWRPALATAIALCGGDRPTAEDVVQNACISCLKHLQQLRTPSRFAPWFLRILTRAARSEVKRNARLQRRDDVDIEDIRSNDDGDVFLRLCLHELKKPLREALVLNAIIGYSSAEVAAILGIPAGTVRFRVHQARARLAALLRHDDASTVCMQHIHEGAANA
jgi:RNA polymerase sigma-70 factor (ECF subfamily)